MGKYHIALTAEEAALLEAIDLSASHANHALSHAAYLANREPILSLLESLLAREAIPAQRLAYWNDPGYNTSAVRTSHEGAFQRFGLRDESIYIHPSFRAYLRYFLFGADLPEGVIAAFESGIPDPDFVTSGDIAPIEACARSLVRQHRLPVQRSAEEFFKLCLDIGLSASVAAGVRRAVMKVR